MSRRIKEDFDNLCDFFKKYSLAPIFEEKDFVKQISTYHKKYYSYLVLVIELKEIVDNANYAPCMSQEQYNYVLESCSDVGQALFLVTHGCYKGAKLLLRSSIENFIKAVCFDEYPDIVIKKSVYEVFDIAKASMTFSGSKKIYSILFIPNTLNCVKMYILLILPIWSILRHLDYSPISIMMELKILNAIYFVFYLYILHYCV